MWRALSLKRRDEVLENGQDVLRLRHLRVVGGLAIPHLIELCVLLLCLGAGLLGRALCAGIAGDVAGWRDRVLLRVDDADNRVVLL